MGRPDSRSPDAGAESVCVNLVATHSGGRANLGSAPSAANYFSLLASPFTCVDEPSDVWTLLESPVSRRPLPIVTILLLATAAAVLISYARSRALCGAASIANQCELLRSDSWSTRHSAAYALGKCRGRSRRCIRPLVNALGDPNRLVRSASATALGEIGDCSEETLQGLARLTLVDGLSPLFALARLGPCAAPSMPVVLLALRSDPDLTVAGAECARAFGAGAISYIVSDIVTNPHDSVSAFWCLMAVRETSEHMDDLIMALGGYIALLPDAPEAMSYVAFTAIAAASHGRPEGRNFISEMARSGSTTARAVIKVYGWNVSD